MNIADVFHLYFSGFIGVVTLLWSWEIIQHNWQRQKKQSHGKCPICETPWHGEPNVFQKRCVECGFRLKIRKIM